MIKTISQTNHSQKPAFGANADTMFAILNKHQIPGNNMLATEHIEKDIFHLLDTEIKANKYEDALETAVYTHAISDTFTKDAMQCTLIDGNNERLPLAEKLINVSRNIGNEFLNRISTEHKNASDNPKKAANLMDICVEYAKSFINKPD